MLSAGKYQNKADPLFAENFPIRAELLAHAIVKVDLAKQIPIDQLFKIERLLENIGVFKIDGFKRHYRHSPIIYL